MLLKVHKFRSLVGYDIPLHHPEMVVSGPHPDVSHYPKVLSLCFKALENPELCNEKGEFTLVVDDISYPISVNPGNVEFSNGAPPVVIKHRYIPYSELSVSDLEVFFLLSIQSKERVKQVTSRFLNVCLFEKEINGKKKLFYLEHNREMPLSYISNRSMRIIFIISSLLSFMETENSQHALKFFVIEYPEQTVYDTIVDYYRCLKTICEENQISLFSSTVSVPIETISDFVLFRDLKWN